MYRRKWKLERGIKTRTKLFPAGLQRAILLLVIKLSVTLAFKFHLPTTKSFQICSTLRCSHTHAEQWDGGK